MKKTLTSLLFLLGLIPLFSCASIMGYDASPMEQKMTEAMLRDDIKQVKALLAQGASPDSRMPTSGAPVLGIAVRNNNIEMAKLLIKAGANVNMKDRYDVSLLHLALKQHGHRLLHLVADHATFNGALRLGLFFVLFAHGLALTSPQPTFRSAAS